MTVIGNIFFILLIWLLITLVLNGWGHLAYRWILPWKRLGNDSFLRLWLGWLVLVGVLMLSQLIFPLDWRTTLLTSAIGLSCSRPVQFWHINRRNFSTLPKAAVYLFPVIVLWLAAHSMQAPLLYDSGLYHLHYIHWLNCCPAATGLANLHMRLAFNQTFFHFAAWLNCYPFFDRGFSLANGWLWLLLFTQCYTAGWRCLTRKPDLNRLASALLLPYLVYTVLTSDLPNPTPDTASYLLRSFGFILFVRMLHFRSRRRNVGLTAVLMVLGLVSATIKISNVFYLGPVLLCAFGLLSLRRYQCWALAQHRVFLFFILLIVSGWMLRGIITSGYPFYPLPYLGLPVLEWSQPAEEVELLNQWIRTSARSLDGRPLENMDSWDWLQPWLANIMHSRKEIIFPLLIAGFLILLHGIQLVRKPLLWKHQL